MPDLPDSAASYAPRIGILGGTFDPVHIGHLVAALEVRDVLGLDVVLLVVANLPWQKVGEREVTGAPDRLALVQAAIDGVDGLAACDLEIVRGGTSYTVDTVDELLGRHPGAELFLLVGSDVATSLGTWKEPERIADEVELVVMDRAGSVPPDLAALEGWDVTVVEVPALAVSSTDLRQRAASGRPLDFLIPRAAIRVISERGLYHRDR